MTARVLVTGATGFVAGHCIAELLEHGYAVRGTVRDVGATAKRAHLTELARRTGGELEFAAATLDDDAGWAEAVAGCDTVLHVASPFPDSPPENERDLIEPAVQGTLRVLRAAAAAGVRRVVLTSSVAAVAYGHGNDDVRTENDWSVVDRIPAYQKSKTLAERAAWEYVESLGDTSDLELVVLNPGMILGPLLEPRTSTSHAPIQRLLARDVPGSVRTGWSPVDVRDLAIAHRLAMEVPAAAGNRYICGGEPLWMAELAGLLARDFGPQGFRVPTRVLPNALVRLVARFDKTVRLTVPVLGRAERVSAEKARRELGWTMRPVEQTVRDTADSLIAFGVVTAPGKRRSAPAVPAGTR
ncbi:NAD-dependent epimerase/dehydratase family protein [Nocardia coubleae]|uniref:NAD-dependent epimerase/dehydratase family protein n=1 Tax=Nocardia coubleae TaxID=356147 RepID=A0A846VYF5_9NOCA|nr:NAD-dependent epimerase/dehydratase family protein [Nocardia coubleae]NKX85862.1 NAD-dependent epimerase/dehydratase family protein [Nocardia coubleae]